MSNEQLFKIVKKAKPNKYSLPGRPPTRWYESSEINISCITLFILIQDLILTYEEEEYKSGTIEKKVLIKKWLVRALLWSQTLVGPTLRPVKDVLVPGGIWLTPVRSLSSSLGHRALPKPITPAHFFFFLIWF